MTAQGLEPSTGGAGYQVWLYNSATKRKSLGATVADEQGNLQVVGELPAGYKDYAFIDVTTVTVSGEGENQSVKEGPSVLRGQLEMAKEPIQTGSGDNKATVLANVPLIPLPEQGG